MPYNKISELPPAVKDNLPPAAQKIFVSAFNSAFSAAKKKGSNDKIAEKSAMSIAWYAVKNGGYVKGSDGKWVKKGKASTEFDKTILDETIPAELQSAVKDIPIVPDVESLLLCPPEVREIFVKAYEQAMANCNNAKGMNCEEESFIMGLIKVRALYDEIPKGNWVSKVVVPPKATLE